MLSRKHSAPHPTMPLSWCGRRLLARGAHRLRWAHVSHLPSEVGGSQSVSDPALHALVVRDVAHRSLQHATPLVSRDPLPKNPDPEHPSTRDPDPSISEIPASPAPQIPAPRGQSGLLLPNDSLEPRPQHLGCSTSCPCPTVGPLRCSSEQASIISAGPPSAFL
eukprot:1317104-Rhodomonas_salina.1